MNGQEDVIDPTNNLPEQRQVRVSAPVNIVVNGSNVTLSLRLEVNAAPDLAQGDRAPEVPTPVTSPDVRTQANINPTIVTAGVQRVEQVNVTPLAREKADAPKPVHSGPVNDYNIAREALGVKVEPSTVSLGKRPRRSPSREAGENTARGRFKPARRPPSLPARTIIPTAVSHNQEYAKDGEINNSHTELGAQSQKDYFGRSEALSVAYGGFDSIHNPVYDVEEGGRAGQSGIKDIIPETQKPEGEGLQPQTQMCGQNPPEIESLDERRKREKQAEKARMWGANAATKPLLAWDYGPGPSTREGRRKAQDLSKEEPRSEDDRPPAQTGKLIRRAGTKVPRLEFED